MKNTNINHLIIKLGKIATISFLVLLTCSSTSCRPLQQSMINVNKSHYTKRKYQTNIGVYVIILSPVFNIHNTSVVLSVFPSVCPGQSGAPSYQIYYRLLPDSSVTSLSAEDTHSLEMCWCLWKLLWHSPV